MWKMQVRKTNYDLLRSFHGFKWVTENSIQIIIYLSIYYYKRKFLSFLGHQRHMSGWHVFRKIKLSVSFISFVMGFDLPVCLSVWPLARKVFYKLRVHCLLRTVLLQYATSLASHGDSACRFGGIVSRRLCVMVRFRCFVFT